MEFDGAAPAGSERPGASDSASASLRRAAPAPAGARLLLAPGPRAAEARLVEEVLAAAHARAARLRAGDLAALRAPLRVVVPSRSLRQHVAVRLVAAAGRSLLGVAVQTHAALALETLARAARAAPRGGVLAPVLARRHAAAQEPLARWLAPLEDGFGVVESAVRDLLDAGFGPAGAEPFAELLAEAVAAGELGVETAARARAVATVALDTIAALDALGLGHRSALLAAARDALESPGADPAALLPTAGLWLHGYADATGLASDWLEALVRAFGGRVLVDVPPDPAAPERRETSYTIRFRERMAAATGAEEETAAAPAAALALLSAPGTDAEVRAVAARARALLDGGVAPEAIGIVARRLEPYRAALQAQLGRLAIPFSALGAGAGPDAAARRAAALARLLEAGAEAAVDDWLAARADLEGADVDLRVALHVLGAGRLRRVAELDLATRLAGDDRLPLPLRRGGAADEDEGGRDPEADAEPAAGRARNRRRHVRRERLERARERAAAAVALLADWPERACFEVHRVRLHSLVEGELGWRPEQAGCGPLLEALAALAQELPADLALAREEWVLLVADALAAAAEAPLGGAGAGVQVLTVTAARGRTFQHLFLLGVHRDGFPRAPVDDPVLPDALRARLRVLLPEMPVKARVRDEERHLFASLCAAAPSVCLVWQYADDDGRVRVESPFVVRLRMARPELVPVIAPALLAAAPGSDPVGEAAPRPAVEHLALGGLRQRRASLVGARALALAEVRAVLREDPVIGDPAAAVLPLAALAAHQQAALRELDALPPAPGAVPPPPGPWLGRVGPAPTPIEDGEPDFHVTRLEALARCPWQAFLHHELGLEPVPDALAALPAPTGLLLGQVAHAVLERIVRVALPDAPEELAEALARGPVRVPWPDDATLEGWLREEAARAAHEQGVAIPGFAAALARRVRPLLDVARAEDWRDPAGPPVLGAELRAVVEVRDGAGRPRRIGFRADRVDRDGGRLVLTDYKTGKARSASGDELKRSLRPDRLHTHLLQAVREGRLLQAAAYHAGGRALAPGLRVESRYLHLHEDAPVLAVPDGARGADLVDAFDGTVRVLLEAADRGLLPPRLGEEGKPPCAWCEVKTACLQGESGPRRRLWAWVAAAVERESAGDLGPEERALLRVLRLPADAKQARAEASASAAEDGV
jgi:hypothetical protein